MSYQKIDMPEGIEAAEVSNNRLGKVVVGLLAVAATTAVVATRGSTSSMQTTELSYEKTGTRPTLHAYVDAMWPDCRRHTLALHEVMLQDKDMLAAVNVKVDYLMSGSSLAEHGYNLIDVNRYELCAQHTTTQAEWWPFTACMYSMQSCLSYNSTDQAESAGQTCSNAESGADDDVTISGIDTVSESCECTVEGVAAECADEYLTSTTFEGLTDCVHGDMGVTLAAKSKEIAEAANSGSPLWIKIDNITMYDSVNEAATIESWAQGVFYTACARIEYLGGDKPKSCDTVMSNSIQQSDSTSLH